MLGAGHSATIPQVLPNKSVPFALKIPSELLLQTFYTIGLLFSDGTGLNIHA
ncbi:MAG: hypothetical protein ACI915_002063 [Gammaproteobacteria bacterium]|jgi:hypothetical protein